VLPEGYIKLLLEMRGESGLSSRKNREIERERERKRERNITECISACERRRLFVDVSRCKIPVNVLLRLSVERRTKTSRLSDAGERIVASHCMLNYKCNRSISRCAPERRTMARFHCVEVF